MLGAVLQPPLWIELPAAIAAIAALAGAFFAQAVNRVRFGMLLVDAVSLALSA
jgi:hypothetical protein